MPSSEISEIANAASQIVAEHQEGQQRTNKHIGRAMAVFVVAMSAIFIWNALGQQRLLERMGQPLPAVVHLIVTTDTPNALVCPGDTLHYTVTRDVDVFMVGRAVSVVKSGDKLGQLEMSTALDTILDVGQVTLSSDWKLPLRLPSTTVRVERPWRAGQYVREIAIASYGGGYEVEPTYIPFRIGANCPGVEG